MKLGKPLAAGRLAFLLAASGLAFVSDGQADVHHGDILDVYRLGAGENICARPLHGG